MELFTVEVKEKVEKYLRENEGACDIVWGPDSCTIFDEDGNAIDDFMIDVEDGHIDCTSVENYQVTIEIE